MSLFIGDKMNWLKIIVFVLSAMIAIGGLYLTKPEKPKLAIALSLLIIVSVIVGIVLEVKDVQSKKQQQKKAEAAYKQLENLNNQNEELIAGKNKVVAQSKELLGKIDKYQKTISENDELIVKLENEINILKHYTRMSFLDYKGLSTGGGAGGLRQATEISGLMEKVVQINNGGYTIGTGEANEAIYKNVIELYPYFPFAYYFLAKSQKERNDALWKSNAEKALEILTQTTKINGHFLHHDQAKKDILTWKKSDQ